MVADYFSLLKKVFEEGNVKDARSFFETCVRNAFPTISFRNLELMSIRTHKKEVEGKSNNHIFTVAEGMCENCRVFIVTCHRSSHGHTPDKRVYIDYNSLSFVKYEE